MTAAEAALWALTVGKMFSDSPTNGEYAMLCKSVVKTAKRRGKVWVFPDGSGLSLDLKIVYSVRQVTKMKH